MLHIESLKLFIEILRSRTISKMLEEEEKILENQMDWKFVSMVIDRVFLWIFVSVCCIGVTVSLITPHPPFFKSRCSSLSIDQDFPELSIQIMNKSSLK